MNNDCPLCGKQNVKLLRSHLIPKLVYRKNKTYQNSRFRNFTNLNKIYQDGEKKYLLCLECEQHFSKFEVVFAKKFEEYLKTGKKKDLLYPEIEKYISSVAWRILYDDVILLNSFEIKPELDIWIKYNNHLRTYLEKLKIDNSQKIIRDIRTYVYTLNEVGYGKEVSELFKNVMFGYCIRTGDYSKYIVLVYYNDLVFATIYSPLVFGRKLKDVLLDKFTDVLVKKELRKEIDYQIFQIAKNQKKYYEFLASEAGDKIKKRYKDNIPN